MLSPAFEFFLQGRWQRISRIILAALLVLEASAVETVSPATAQAQATTQCVACHSDAGRLQALTPPDPPSAEEGEG